MKLSLLDRLVDAGDDGAIGTVRQRALTFNQARTAVIRDLENLLNTRSFAYDLPDSCQELAKSVFVYGVSDHTSDNPGNPAVRIELRQELEKAIQLFEPRLRNITVRVEEADRKERAFRFKITAMLVMDRESEPVSFNTYFDVNSGEYRVSG